MFTLWMFTLWMFTLWMFTLWIFTLMNNPHSWFQNFGFDKR